ncbi:MAG: hypothetical protein ABL900_07200 [Burkholderiaceae bacterium]
MLEFTFPDEAEYAGKSLEAAVRDFVKEQAPRPRLPQFFRTDGIRRTCKLCVPPDQRDAALRVASALQKRLPSEWRVSVGSPAPTATSEVPYVVRVREEPIAKPEGPSQATWMPLWLAALVEQLTGHRLSPEPVVSTRDVKDAVVAAFRRAVREQPAPIGHHISNVEVRHVHRNWAAPLQAYLPTFKRQLQELRPPLCAPNVAATAAYLVDSIGPDLLLHFDTHKVDIALAFAPNAAEPATEPPQYDDGISTLPPSGDVPVRLTKDGKTVTGHLPTGPDGTLTFQRVPGSPLFILLQQVGALRQVSGQQRNALRLRVEKSTVEVLAAGEPGRFSDAQGRLLGAGMRLSVPASIRVGGSLLIDLIG